LTKQITQNDIIRFFTYIERQPDGCLVFTIKDTKGYGKFDVNGRTKVAHRLMWELFRGPIPKGHHIHHKCGRRDCINLKHLETLPEKDHRARHKMSPERKTARRRETQREATARWLRRDRERINARRRARYAEVHSKGRTGAMTGPQRFPRAAERCNLLPHKVRPVSSVGRAPAF